MARNGTEATTLVIVGSGLGAGVFGPDAAELAALEAGLDDAPDDAAVLDGAELVLPLADFEDDPQAVSTSAPTTAVRTIL